ncbi:sulfurtransferase [Nocardioides yefusunii]|uniref:thiosulfate sulfurtransferase n=1 Tax=Nocardioides yefusunii TaxID=2500546 RepID=A0ABW1QYN9_9ACTN|nr:rhodanese-like domain-containing protein [Nocardioides yefusunii]
MNLNESPIVSPEQLRDALDDDPNLHVIEVLWNAPEVGSTPGLIPGSVAVHWKGLAWHETDRLFATAEEFAERLFALGAGEGSTIVLAGEPRQFASYVVWAMWMRGIRGIGYLDGGREAWTALGYPTADDVVRTPVPATAPIAVPALSTEEIEAAENAVSLGRDEVLSLLGDENTVILDLRTPEEYAGERVLGYEDGDVDHGAERKGRIPGATHLYFRDILDEHGRFLPAEQLRELLAERGALDAERVVAYCRLSHRASLGWLAMTQVVGMENVRVYNGSWTEWGSIVGFPIEK